MFGIFHVTTVHGTSLAAALAKNEIVHTPSDNIGIRQPLVYVHLTPKCLGHAFLLVDDASMVPVAPRYQLATSPIVVVRHVRLGGDGISAFSHPQRKNFLLAHNEISPDGTGMVAFHAHEVGAWEQFRLHELTGAVPVSIRYQMTLIDRALATPPLSIPQLLRDASLAERPVLSALLPNGMSTEQAEILAAFLLARQRRVSEFAELLPADPWANRGLRDLADFLARRAGDADPVNPLPQPKTSVAEPATAATLPRPGFLSRLLSGTISAPAAAIPTLTLGRSKAGEIIGPELDRLANDGSSGNYASVAHKSLVMARSVIAPIKDLCVLTTLRNEGLYIVDWLAYHQSIGVDKCFIYTNNNTDGSDALLEALAAADEIRLFQSRTAPGGNPQGKAYGHALSLVPEILDYRWCAIIDGDEFLGFDKSSFPSFKDYLLWQELAPVDAIALSWNMVTSCGARVWNDVPLPLRFQQRCAGADVHIKSICRPRLFHHSTPHVPISDGRRPLICRDAVGEPHEISSPWAKTPRDTHAWIAHYFYRSVEEYIWKWSRGRGDDAFTDVLPQINIPEEFIAAYLKQARDFPLVSDERMAVCAEGLMAQRERLMRLPGVAAARASVVEHYRARSASLMPTLRALRAGASSVASEFYDLLLEQKTA